MRAATKHAFCRCRCGLPRLSGLIRPLIGAAGFFLPLVSGCGAKPVESHVRGLVTGDGKPLPDAVITFQALDAVAADQRSYRVVSGGEGRYDLKGIRPGSYQVLVVAGGGGGPQGDQVVAQDTLAPPNGKPLQVVVGPDPTDFDISLVRQ